MADFESSPDLTKLMTIDPTGLSDDDAMTLAALLVDLSADAASAGGLDRAEDVLTSLEVRDLDPAHRAHRHYFIANLWSIRRHQLFTTRPDLALERDRPGAAGAPTRGDERGLRRSRPSAVRSTPMPSSRVSGSDPPSATSQKNAQALDAYLTANPVEVDLHGHPLGRGCREREYRRWCLARRLFINPLNDAETFEIAARDVMMLPSITVVGLDGGPGPPPVIAYFNLIKQEHAAARFACWEGLTTSDVHFAERGGRSTIPYVPPRRLR